jgi:transcriptional regulator with XRE-family HTH domain
LNVERQLREHLARPVPEAARLRRVGELLAKRNSGRKLTRGELGELEAFAEGSVGAGGADGSVGEPRWVSSREKLGAILGVHPNTLPQWIAAHREDPALRTLKRANGDWNVPAWRAFMERHGLEGDSKFTIQTGGLAASISRKLDLELQRLEEQVREIRRTNDAEERKFLLRVEVEEWIARRAGWIRGRLLKLKREMPPRFAGLGQAEFGARLGPLVDQLIGEFTEAKAGGLG